VDGVLVILPTDTGASEPIAPQALVGGLPALRRIVLAAERAGFRPMLLARSGVGLDRCLAGTSTDVVPPGGPIPTLAARRLVFLPMTVIPRSDWLRRLREIRLEPGRLLVDGTTAAVVETTDPAPLLALIARCRSMSEAVTMLRARFETKERSLDDGGRFVVATARDLPAAEAWLLRSLIKPSEGFMSRHVERRISLALTRRLCTTRITPNMMTLLSLAVGLAGAPFFLSAASVYQLAGALLFLAHSILDGCDGELARLKFLESRRGAALDILGDNLVHAAVFGCMAVGWSLHRRSAWPLLLGGVTVVSTLAVAAIVYRRGMRASTEGGPTSALSRLADVVVYRDFIYLIVLLAAAGRAHWFLALTAVGAPLFLLLLAWLGRRR